MPNDTWIDVVHEYFPTATEEQCEKFMWNATCFPFGNKDQIYKNIQKASLESNANIELAMAQADEVTRTAMRQYHEQHG